MSQPYSWLNCFLLLLLLSLLETEGLINGTRSVDNMDIFYLPHTFLKAQHYQTLPSSSTEDLWKMKPPNISKSQVRYTNRWLTLLMYFYLTHSGSPKTPSNQLSEEENVETSFAYNSTRRFGSSPGKEERDHQAPHLSLSLIVITLITSFKNCLPLVIHQNTQYMEAGTLSVVSTI